MALWQVCPRCRLVVARGFEQHIAWHDQIADLVRLGDLDTKIEQAKAALIAVRNRLEALEATDHTHS